MKTSNNKCMSKIEIKKNYRINYKKILGEQRQYQRSITKIEENNNVIKIYIKSDDVTALRATINATIRDIGIIESTITSTK